MLVTSIFSFSHNVFLRPLKHGLCVEGLTLPEIRISICYRMQRFGNDEMNKTNLKFTNGLVENCVNMKTCKQPAFSLFLRTLSKGFLCKGL